MEGSVYRFIIDIGSFRGLQDEIKQLNIQQQLDQIEKEFNSWPLYFQILFAMIIKIEDEFKEKTNIILYSNCENRTSIELKCMVDQRFESDNIKVVVGQQSLFYMLGWSSKEKATVRWISNERFFFSQPFLQTIKSIKDEFEWKVYSLFQFGDAIKH